MIRVDCAYCKKSVWRRSHDLKKYGRSFCSRRCQNKYHAKGNTTVKHEGRIGRGERSVRLVSCPWEFEDMAWKSGQVLEHRLIMAKSLGRSLLTTEVIHHIDRDSLNNRLENLILFENQEAHRDYEALEDAPF